MSETLLTNPHFWTDRAEELRAIAEGMRPAPQREQVLRLADLDAAVAERAKQGRRPLDAIAATTGNPGFYRPSVREGRDG